MSSVLTTLEELFDNWREEESKSKLHGLQPTVIEYPTINRNDWEAVSVIAPDEKQGPWIAGGAPLRWYQGQPVGESDIDVFCANAKQAADVIDRVKAYGRHYEKFKSENAVTLDYNNKDNYSQKWTIQIITRRYFSTMQEVLDNFDITVCQIGTDGNSWHLGKHTARDIRERNLRMNIPLQPDALKRLVKYWTYGYRPVDGLLDIIQNNPNAKWTFNAETEDYQNAF